MRLLPHLSATDPFCGTAGDYPWSPAYWPGPAGAAGALCLCELLTSPLPALVCFAKDDSYLLEGITIFLKPHTAKTFWAPDALFKSEPS